MRGFFQLSASLFRQLLRKTVDKHASLEQIRRNVTHVQLDLSTPVKFNSITAWYDVALISKFLPIFRETMLQLSSRYLKLESDADSTGCKGRHKKTGTFEKSSKLSLFL